MYFDMNYIFWVVIPGMLISGIASWMVKSAFNRYSQVATRRGYTGAQAAQKLLDRAGITDVQVVRTQGYLSDHYNPMNKTLALSEPVYDSTSVAAVGVATHEAGHAIQHATNYAPLWIRSLLVPTANIGSSIGMFAMIGGLALMTMGGAIGQTVFIVGVALFACVLAFQLVTLPVEFNASLRARKLVVESGIIDVDERTGVDKVLTAAAMTYVAAAVQTAMTLVYFLLRSGLLGGRD